MFFKSKVKGASQKDSAHRMDQSYDIIKRLEEENNVLKEQLLRLEADKKGSEKDDEAKLTENESIFRCFFDNSVDGLFLMGDRKSTRLNSSH